MSATDREILIWTIIGTLLVLGTMTFIIVANKAWREAREAIARRRRATFEPEIFRYAGATDTRSIRDYLRLPLTPGDRDLVEAVLIDVAGLLKGASRERITAAAEALGMIADNVDGLRSRAWWRRAEAAEKLGVLGSKQAVDPLVAALDDPSAEVRLRAARALGLIRGQTSIRPLVQALADPSRWSAIRLSDILIGAGEEAVDELLAAYETLPSSARVTALDILGRIRTPRAATLLRRAIADEMPDVRARAAHAMGLLADGSFEPFLTKALDDESWAVRAMAAKALGRTKAKGAIRVLAAKLADREWWVRSNAGDALRLLGPEGREALLAALDAQDNYARHQALAQLQEGGVVDDFIGDLASDDPARRATAARFIEKVAALGRVRRLSDQAVSHTHESVRRSLLDILKKAPEGAS
ncbi:MAG TPA: HEAT repeat domain-containing protein [Candidatus Polarisedimenticolia bacterium]|nr:HEAT repeat domain-containing protein [Candidatus Polarisedimenticolia bacterium]